MEKEFFDLENMDEAANIIAGMLIDQFEICKAQAAGTGEEDMLPLVPSFSLETIDFDDVNAERIKQLEDMIRQRIEDYYFPVILH